MSLGQRQTFADKRLFYEWFVMALCVVFGSEQSPGQASFAKSSVLLVIFWKKILRAIMGFAMITLFDTALIVRCDHERGAKCLADSVGLVSGASRVVLKKRAAGHQNFCILC